MQNQHIAAPIFLVCRRTEARECSRLNIERKKGPGNLRYIQLTALNHPGKREVCFQFHTRLLLCSSVQYFTKH